MRKILFVISAIALLSACTKSEVAYTEDVEIGLKPLTKNITKAMVDDTAFPNESFAVWAYYKQLGKGTSIAIWQSSTLDQQTYINEKPFSQRGTTGLWGGEGAAYYWPKVGSLMFVGYYPVSIDAPTESNPDGKVKYEFSSSVNKMTVTGYSPTTDDYVATGFVNTAEGANHVEDFMYFNMTSASCDATTPGPVNSVTSGNHIDVVFKHALSWLTVVLKKDSSTPAGATITVKSVHFSEVNTAGTGTVNNSPAQGESNVISWDTTTSDEIDVYVLGSSTTANTVALTNDYTCKQPVIIPQEMDGNIVITYEIKSTDGSAFTETKTLPLSGLTSSVTSWDPAKKYTYTITIGTSEILIDPAITDWTDVEATIDVK